MYSSMAFSTEDDPYPPSLPKMGSPGMTLCEPASLLPLHPSSGEAFPGDTANDYDRFEVGDFFRDATTSLGHECAGTVRPADLSLDRASSLSASPTSSSNSSIQHQRHPSSNSSRSATFGSQSGVPDEAPMHKLRLESAKALAESPKRTLEPTSAQEDMDLQMNALFDFDSAANSPGDSATREGSLDKATSGLKTTQCKQTPRNIERPIHTPHNQSRHMVGAFRMRSLHTPPVVMMIELDKADSGTRATDPWSRLRPASDLSVFGSHMPCRITHLHSTVARGCRTQSHLHDSTATPLLQLCELMLGLWVRTASDPLTRHRCSTFQQPLSRARSPLSRSLAQTLSSTPLRQRPVWRHKSLLQSH